METVTWSDWLLDEHESFCSALQKEQPQLSADSVAMAGAVLTLSAVIAEIFGVDVPD